MTRAPAHLSEEMRRWWREVESEYDLDTHHRRLLQLAGEAWDESQAARATLAEDGLTVLNRYGSPVAHPAVAIEQRARADFARLLRQLDLDGETDPSFRRRTA